MPAIATYWQSDLQPITHIDPLFAFGLMCKTKVRDRWVPLVAILAPALCLVLDLNSVAWFGGYHFSYEILPLNAIFTMAGLWLLRRR